MRNLVKLNQQLLKAEFDIAKAIHDQSRNDGYSAVQAAAIIYRHGYLDGRDSQKSRTQEAYKKMYALRQELQSRPEATETATADYEEGEIINE